jgi:hypothetical protein
MAFCSEVEKNRFSASSMRSEVENIDLQRVCGWRSISSTSVQYIVGNLSTILRRLDLLHWTHQWMIFGRFPMVAKNAYKSCYVGPSESACFHLHGLP